MKWFYNMKIGTKLVSSFVVVALIAAVIGYVGYWGLNEIAEVRMPSIQGLMTMSEAQTAVLVGERGLINEAFTGSTREAQYAYIDSAFQRAEEGWALYEPLPQTPEEAVLWSKFVPEWEQWMADHKVVYDLAKEVDSLLASGLTFEDPRVHNLEMQAVEASLKARETFLSSEALLNQIVELNVNLGHDTMVKSETMIWSFTGIGVLLALVLGFFISAIIKKPVKKSLDMIDELNKGKLNMRLNVDTKDELGQMARAMDDFADALQEDVVGSMQKIAKGDFNINLELKDENDEITPAIQKTVSSINEIMEDTNMLIKATQEGKLDTRGDASKYEGSWKELLEGVNHLVDAFVAPINITAEYVERISKGDIPNKITDTYKGDFNEIKNSINLLIDSLDSFILDMKNMSEQHDLGEIDVVMSEEKFEGAYKTMAKGVNDMVNGHISVKKKAMGCVGEFAKGNFDAPLEQFPGKKAFINEGIEKLRGNVKEFISDMKYMSEQHDLGDIDVVVPEDKFEGAYKVMAKGVNDMVNGHISVKKKAMGCLAEFAKGNFDAELEKFPGKKAFINENIEGMRKNLKDVNSEINKLILASEEGRLSERGNADAFRGDWARMIQGLNGLIEKIVEPVLEASDVLEQMAKGNLSVSVKGDYKGDHAKIKNAMNDTIQTIASYITEISQVLGKMADGDMVVEISRDYRGDFMEIKNALNNIIDSFNEVLSNLNDASDQVASGSRQISDSSQALSQGSTEQASSVEELSASITEVATQTKENAENAEEANRISTSAKDNAQKGNKQMQEMLGAMSEINESSANISKIIKVIDEIAFQTNILALNAAVEAARAGQHGKGFAVVAEEVRNLAARSANAAKETTSLIEGSVEKVEVGTKIAQETADALTHIVEDVDKTTMIVANIAKASNEQATGISQINRGIEQVSQVVQTNSATAEEGAAASEELSGQATILRDMVGKFRLKGASHKATTKTEKPVSQVSSQPTKKSEAQSVIDEFKPQIELLEAGFDKY